MKGWYVMCTEPKTLIVVYKDELVLNQLKKFVETNDDDKENGKIVGTEDGSVIIVAWNEKMWLEQKKAGTIDSKVLFIGNTKGIDKLAPIIDVKYDKWGIKYGWAGKQALLQVDETALLKRENYNAFLEAFKKAMLPRKEEERLPVKIAKKGGIFFLFGLIGLSASVVADLFEDKNKVKQQQLLFGVAELYRKDLETFMKS